MTNEGRQMWAAFYREMAKREVKERHRPTVNPVDFFAGWKAYAAATCIPCTWSYQDYEGCYDTQCGRSFSVESETLSESFLFCPYCSGEIRAVTNQ